MIRRFRHRGLKRLYGDDDPRGVNSEHVERIKRILQHLEQASEPRDIDLPGWRLHPLKGERTGYWSVTVRANWRIVFRFDGGDVTDVDYLDYH